MRYLLSLILLVYTSSALAICSDSIQSNTPNKRYQILNNGAEVKDLQTSLIWQRCSVGQTWNGTICQGEANLYTWQEALTVSKQSNNGFVIPNIKALSSLLNRACYNPAINEKIFPNTPNTSYWSSSPSVELGYIWNVAFGAAFLGQTISNEVRPLPSDTPLALRLIKYNP